MCEKCGCIENTASGAYWGRDKKICSECETGKWHGIFKKKSAVGMFIDQNNHLWSKVFAGSGSSPFSEWVTKTCPECEKKAETKARKTQEAKMQQSLKHFEAIYGNWICLECCWFDDRNKCLCTEDHNGDKGHCFGVAGCADFAQVGQQEKINYNYGDNVKPIGRNDCNNTKTRICEKTGVKITEHNTLTKKLEGFELPTLCTICNTRESYYHIYGICEDCFEIFF